MNDPHRNAGAAAFADRRDPACDDPELLRKISKGDEDAMAAFYRKHGKVVLAQVLLVTGERVLAEEIAQDTMLAVWRGAASFRGESSVRSWVIAIARRQTGTGSVDSGCELLMTPSLLTCRVRIRGRR